MLRQLKPSTCICCGEPMSRGGGALSRNPNMCASCSSLADGMQVLGITGCAAVSGSESPSLERTESEHDSAAHHQTFELAGHGITSVAS